MKKLLCCVLLIATILVLASCGAQTVKVQDFIEIEYSPAYNGYAEPELNIDTDGLDDTIDNKKILNYLKGLMKADKDNQEFASAAIEMFEENPDMLPGFTDFFEIDFVEDYEGLKNGDKIKAKISLESSLAEQSDMSVQDVAKKLGIKFSKTEFEFKVKGLEDLNTIDVDLDKLLKVDFGKYEGYASPSVEVDYGYFDGLLINEVVDDFARKAKNNEVKNILSRDSKEWFTVSFDKAYDGIKNGDIVTVNIVLDDVFTDADISIADFEAGLALNLNGGTNTYSVEGLIEPENVLDIFEGIEQYIVYEGANGNGRIGSVQVEIPKAYSRQVGDLYFSKEEWAHNSINIIHNNDKIGTITYYVKGEKLSGGDVVEITASCPTDVLEDLGYIVPTTHKNTTVPDLGEYLRTKDQLNSDVLTAIKDKIYAEAEVTSIDKLYLATYKPGIECKYDSTTFIVGIYYKKGFWSTGYQFDAVYDIIIKPDNSIVVETYDYDADTNWSAYDTLDEVIAQLDVNSYDFVELN